MSHRPILLLTACAALLAPPPDAAGQGLPVGQPAGLATLPQMSVPPAALPGGRGVPLPDLVAPARAASTPTIADTLGGLRIPELAGPPLTGSLEGLTDTPLPALAPAQDIAAGAQRTLALAGSRLARRDALIRQNPGLIEADPNGEPALRGQVVALAPSPQVLARLRAEGFKVRPQSGGDPLGLGMRVIEAPKGLSAARALERLRRLDPAGSYDFNHLYLDAGAVAGPAARSRPDRPAGKLRVGLVDGGLDAAHPALRGVGLTQRGFAPGGVRPSDHGLAVASLLAGAQGRFRGAAPGASLYAADVYGSTPAGGSVQAIAAAFNWMAQLRVPVVNVSLVGPPNIVLRAAVDALRTRGALVVAAVGNDGPAAPPLYPAAYPGVVAVTAVDARARLLPEAGRGSHVDFAAPGADMAAAGAGGFVAVRGTSFAAPIVAGQLARRLSAPDPAAAATALAALGRDAVDLGPRGPDRSFGRGLVGREVAVPPAAVSARGLLAGR